MMRTTTALRSWLDTELSPLQRKALMISVVLLAIMAFSAVMASAGATGTEFKSAYDKLSGWLNGYLGRAIALAFFVVGLFQGIVRQSIMAACIALGVAFVILLLPSILNTVLSVTI